MHTASTLAGNEEKYRPIRRWTLRPISLVECMIVGVCIGLFRCSICTGPCVRRRATSRSTGGTSCRTAFRTVSSVACWPSASASSTLTSTSTSGETASCFASATYAVTHTSLAPLCRPNNNNNYDNVYGVVIMTKVIATVHAAHLMNVDWGPGGRRISRDVPDLCRAVPRPGKTSPGTPNVPDFKVKSKQRK